MTKLFAVEITYTTVIRADDEFSAEMEARDAVRDIIGDSNGPDEVNTLFEIETADQLHDLPGGEWNVSCLPYGDTDSNTTIGDYLKESNDD